MQKRDHSAELAIKVNAIQIGAVMDTLTPIEFVAYVMNSNKRDGLYDPVSPAALSLKINGRDSYFTETRRDLVRRPGATLPMSMAAALANLSGTDIHLWQKTDYTLQDAKGIAIDMDKPAMPAPRESGAQADAH